VSDFDFKRAIPFIDAIPSGRWTAYKDVAAAAGNPKAFMAAGNQMRDSGGSIPNYWRVTHSDGSVPENFIAPADRGPKDPYSARQKLMKEGARFNLNGLADPNQYFSYEDWRRAGKRPATDETAAVAERDKRIVADVNQRRIAKGQAPLTAVQEAEMLDRLAAKRAAGRR
jgi:alkylated DNA nucleotide flippase Atl1